MQVRAVGDTGADSVAPESVKQAGSGGGRMLWWRLASVVLFCGALALLPRPGLVALHALLQRRAAQGA